MDNMPIGVPELAIILMVCLFVVAGAVLVLWPLARILRRMGFSPWLSLVYIIPLANLVLLWYVAYTDWPKVQPLSKG